MANIFRPGSWLRNEDRYNPADASAAPLAAERPRANQELPMAASSVGLGIRERIEQRAYFRWCEDGCPPGRDLEYWLAAEREVLTEYH